tara:strand:+ start:12799 stop:14349 length:1551 start_codon:yes stop_codon:yes gene_type:complete
MNLFLATSITLVQVLAPLVLSAGSLSDRINEIIKTSAADQAFWGIQVTDIHSGRILYEQHQDKLFVPASNGKLFSTALALAYLGSEYVHTTTVGSGVSIGEDGTLDGDLVLLGGGDPNLSSRSVPYNPKREFAVDRLAPLRELAQQVSLAGVKKIAGNVIGDDSRYVWQRQPSGWSVDDSVWGYGAPVSALSFNDSTVDVQVLPGHAARAYARVAVRPDVGYFKLNNILRTATTRMVPRGLNLDRPPGTRKLTLWGEISIHSRGRKLSIAVDDPALFAAQAFRQALNEAGLEVEGKAIARHSFGHQFSSLKRSSTSPQNNYPTELAAINSPSLAETIKIVNKTSQNLHAEMLLREVGLRQRGVGSYQAGLATLREFLSKKVGLRKGEFTLLDASGLSRGNLVSPAATVKLLVHMWKSPGKEVFLSSLPISGEDGTLDWRFSRTSARGKIRAKTGTLAHVTAIAGYVSTADQYNLAFSIMVNNYGVQASYIRNLVDKICVVLSESKIEGDNDDNKQY